MRNCVIYNPAAGRSRSQRRLAKFREQWHERAEFWPTKFRGHGVELARAACEQGFSVVAAAGGDGTVHDVANGLLQAKTGDATLAVVPVGSANDYAYSLERQFGASKLDDENYAKVDVGSVTTSCGRESFFVVSLGLGLSARVTLESRKVSQLQGKALYALGVWCAVKANECTDLTLQFDDEAPANAPSLLLSVMVCEREGNFVLAPKRSPRRWPLRRRIGRADEPLASARLAAADCTSRPAGASPQVTHSAAAASLTVQSPTPLVAHTDGEMLCTDADAVHDLTIRILPARLRVKLCLPVQSLRENEAT